MADSPSSSRDLQAWLEQRFRSGGGLLPFESYMAEALYHPSHGYYTRHIRALGGARGDFATSPSLSRLLGEAIAAWALSEAEAAGLRPPLTLVECGAGEGALMAAVLAALDRRGGWRQRLGGRRCQARLVEISPRLRQRQREALRPWGERAAWHETMQEALEAAGGSALVISNELADAFPAMVLRREAGGGWSELHLSFDPATGLREHFVPLEVCRPGFPGGAFSALGLEWPGGQRVEVHDTFRRWLGGWAPVLRRGSVLAIDYGGGAAEIYQRRPGGTLRAYFRHQRHEGAGIYRLFGRQDLTADVCFDDLRRWGEDLGWETIRDCSQARFLGDFAGAACASAARVDRAAAFLFQPGGAGEAFRVLAQRAPG